MKIFIGIREPSGLRVFVDEAPSCFTFNGNTAGLEELARRRGRELDLRLDLRNHSPTGFECGYGGSGPAQLSLAMLVEVIGEKRALTRNLYQGVKWRTVARLPQDSHWVLREPDILAAVDVVGAA